MTGLPPDVFIPTYEDSVCPETTDNRVIEGDNLAVLESLVEIAAETVKLVYIDPPYNTGKRFTYRDDHRTDWVDMMRPRLEAMRTLLREDGAMVVHIDEHEHARLSLLLEEIFGADNNLGTIVWDKLNPKGDASGIATQHEFILCWAKNRTALSAAHPLQREKTHATRMLNKAHDLLSQAGADIDLAAVNQDFRKWIRGQRQLSGGEAAYNRIDEEGRVFQAVSMAWPNKRRAPDAYFEPLHHPTTGEECPVPERGWRNPPETMARLLSEQKIVFGADHTTQPRRKYFLAENRTERIPSILRDGTSDDERLRQLGTPFDHPKPVSIAQRIVRWFTAEPGDLVLDGFAGSGTVGHAVLAENAERQAGLRFVLIQTATPVEADSAAARAGFSHVSELLKTRLKACIEQMNATQPARTEEDRGFIAERWSGQT